MTLTIGNSQLKLVERLCNAVAVSSAEDEVRAIVMEEVHPHADDIKTDTIGNILVTKKGRGKKRLRVMLDAHMDEVGFVITVDEGEGIYRFELVGGVDERQLLGKPVTVGVDHTPGVIGARPIHLTTAEERDKKIPVENLRIDLGLGDGKVKIGEYGTFATLFQRKGENLVGKAFDDRIGVATLIELIKNAPTTIDLFAAFTVQEEVGLRGASVAAYTFDPNLAIAVDSTPANDLPAWDGEENTAYNTRLGHGPAIYVADGATLSDPRLIRLLSETAEAEGIPYQFRQPGSGGTDAGAIHLQREGIPAVSVSVPCRYAHTAVGLVQINDWKHTLMLLYSTLKRLSPDFLAQERA